VVEVAVALAAVWLAADDDDDDDDGAVAAYEE